MAVNSVRPLDIVTLYQLNLIDLGQEPEIVDGPLLNIRGISLKTAYRRNPSWVPLFGMFLIGVI